MAPQRLGKSSKCQRDEDVKANSDGCDASDQHSQQQAKRSRLHHGPYPPLDDRRAAMTNKIRAWDKPEIQSLISRAVEPPFLSASAIHPTASILADCISIPRVPLSIFEITCSLLRSNPRTSAWKCEFFRRRISAQAIASRSRRGNLIITMPSRIHEAFVTFGTDICDQIFASQFLPPQYERTDILQTGSVDFNYGTVALTPDASVSIFDSRHPFLVLEVAFSEKERHAQRKAQDYILESKGAITFVVLIIVNKLPKKKSTDADLTTTSPPENSYLSAQSDTVHVHVYRSVVQPASGPQPHLTLTGRHVIDKLPIFPSPGPLSDQTFDIAWADINRGTWSDFCKNARLLESPPPVCAINFTSLVSISWSLTDNPQESRNDIPRYHPGGDVHVPISQTVRFLNSSSPAPYLSSGESISSGGGRRLDPNYQPSEGSSGSFSSC